MGNSSAQRRARFFLPVVLLLTGALGLVVSFFFQPQGCEIPFRSHLATSRFAAKASMALKASKFFTSKMLSSRNAYTHSQVMLNFASTSETESLRSLRRPGTYAEWREWHLRLGSAERLNAKAPNAGQGWEPQHDPEAPAASESAQLGRGLGILFALLCGVGISLAEVSPTLGSQLQT